EVAFLKPSRNQREFFRRRDSSLLHLPFVLNGPRLCFPWSSLDKCAGFGSRRGIRAALILPFDSKGRAFMQGCGPVLKPAIQNAQTSGIATRKNEWEREGQAPRIIPFSKKVSRFSCGYSRKQAFGSHVASV